MTPENWNARMLDVYRKNLDAGIHDRDCEQRERYALCGCRFRKRVREGRTGRPPILLYQAPMCDGCGGDVTTDAGDCWRCDPCGVEWPMGGFDEPGTWQDVEEDYSASTAERYGERMIVLATEVSR